MRLLLTRASEDANRTRRKLEAMGHHVLVAPVIEIAATGARWPAGVVDAVVATSGHAFEVLSPASSLPTPEARRLMLLLLVGRRTEVCARRLGFRGEAVVAETAAKLVDNLARMPRRVLYLAGCDRKTDIEVALPVETIEVYEALAADELDPTTALALARTEVDGVLHFSRRSAELFLALTAKAQLSIETLAHYCLSQDVAAPLKEVGVRSLKVAEAPTEAALLSMLRS